MPQWTSWALQQVGNTESHPEFKAFITWVMEQEVLETATPVPEDEPEDNGPSEDENWEMPTPVMRPTSKAMAKQQAQSSESRVKRPQRVTEDHMDGEMAPEAVQELQQLEARLEFLRQQKADWDHTRKTWGNPNTQPQ